MTPFGILVDVMVRFEFGELKNLTPEQIHALMQGIGRVISIQSSIDQRTPGPDPMPEESGHADGPES